MILLVNSVTVLYFSKFRDLIIKNKQHELRQTWYIWFPRFSELNIATTLLWQMVNSQTILNHKEFWIPHRQYIFCQPELIFDFRVKSKLSSSKSYIEACHTDSMSWDDDETSCLALPPTQTASWFFNTATGVGRTHVMLQTSPLPKVSYYLSES